MGVLPQQQSPVTTGAAPRWAWRLSAYVCAVIVALGIAYFVAKSPLQLNDGVDNLLELQRQDLSDLMTAQLQSQGYVRPMLWAALKITFDLSNGHYFEMYKAIHALQLLLVGLLFVSLLHVDSFASVLAVPFGVAVLFGNHTFWPMAYEGFPINHFLTVVVLCLIAARLSFGRPALWHDVAAVALFVFAVLTVETGLLVWVILAAGWLAGCRGVSTRTVVMATAALLGYFVWRFGVLDAGTPELFERSSGFGFRILDPPEIIERFGRQPAVFYAYNVVSQICTVLFAEPYAGTWNLTLAIATGTLLPREILGVVASTGATVVIAAYAISRARDWRHGLITDHDRLILMFVAVLGANAAISFPYTKTHIAAPAGVFHALAAAVGVAHALGYLARQSTVRPAAVMLVVGLAVLSGLWAFRLAGLHYRLHEHAFIVRNDWARMGPTSDRWGLPQDPEGQVMVRQLYEQAVLMQVPGTYFYPRWMDRYFEMPW